MSTDDAELRKGLAMNYVDEIATGLGLPETDVLTFCNLHGVLLTRQNGRQSFFIGSDFDFVWMALKYPKYRNKMVVLRNDYSETIRWYHPELSQYLCYHDTLDIFCWMLKIRYSSAAVVRKKSYRIDVLFDEFLSDRKYDISRLRRLIGDKASPEQFVFHLKKGWYNELIRSSPLHDSMLNIGTQVDDNITRGKSLSWNITQSYYSVYEFVNALVFTNTDNCRTEQHKATTHFFESGLRSKLTNRLIPYPFSITNPEEKTLKNLRGKQNHFWTFKYSACPRNRSKSIYDLEKDYVESLADDKNFIAFLYDFRVWANYQGIDSIIEVEDGYFLAYLYRNLGTVCFFYACFAELMGIALLGEQRMIDLLQEVAEKFILKQEDYAKNHFLIPVFIRFRFYQKHGLIQNPISFLIPETDPICI